MSEADRTKSKILDIVFHGSGSINLSELKEAGFNLNFWNWLYNSGFRYDGSGSFYIPNFEKF